LLLLLLGCSLVCVLFLVESFDCFFYFCPALSLFLFFVHFFSKNAMRFLLVFLVGCLLGVMAVAQNSTSITSIVVNRFSAAMEYEVMVTNGCHVLWSGVRGVWKLGRMAGSCASWPLFLQQLGFLADAPPFVLFDSNASEWASVTVKSGDTEKVYDTRNVAHTSWDQTLKDGISLLDFYIDNTTWFDPDPEVRNFEKERKKGKLPLYFFLFTHSRCLGRTRFGRWCSVQSAWG
jgi:hypothetical protein